MANMQSTGQTAGQPPQAPAPKERPPKPVPPPEFQAGELLKLDQAALLKIVKDPKATVFQKSKACQQLASVGTKEAVPALAALLSHPQLAHYGRWGLEPIPDPAVDEALRAALPKLKGLLLVGAINSIGFRKDGAAIAPLARLMYDSDAEVAKAAAAALGSISGPQASKALQDGLAKTRGPLRAAVAAAGIVCAEGLLARGDRKEALALYDVLTSIDMPKPVRLAAMHGTIAAETSLNRPR
jgi:HEAT repeat protein